MGGLVSQMYLPAWVHELQYESDRNLASFIHEGIAQGFHIVDADSQIQEYDCHNYSTVLRGDSSIFVDGLIKQEIKMGKLLLVADKPKCINSLGAVDEADGSYRPITDCRRPIGSSINCYI